jgi:hypothetical protein
MKSLLIATAALSLVGGAAFAQSVSPAQATAAPGPTNDVAARGQSGTTASDQASGALTGPQHGDAMTSQGAASSSQTRDPTTNMASGSGAMSGTPDEGQAQNDVAAGGQKTWPMCSAKVHDDCRQRSQGTRMASNTVRMRHMKRAGSSSGDQTATTSPGL